MKRLILFTFFTFHFSFFTLSLFAQRPFTVLTYNCENAFDTLDTPGHSDEAFLPQGEYRWSRWRFYQKLQRIAQVMLAADTRKPLDIAVLQEVENDTVLHYLLNNTSLHSIGYKYVMTDSRDQRGIDVAVVYSPLTFHILGSSSISLSDTFLRKHKATPTRDALHVWGIYHGRDTLDVVAVHMPSRVGGAEAALKRKEMFRLLNAQIDSLCTVRSKPQIIVAGDFNDSPRHSFTNLANLMMKRRDGSYKFRGHWDWIDQIHVSPALEPYSSIRLLDLPFLLEDDTSWGGKKPFRTFLGPHYHGGYSDHLPVVLTLQW